MNLNKSGMFEKKSHHLISGRVQSGKTRYILSICEEALYRGYFVIIIALNKVCGLEQYTSRINNYNKNARYKIIHSVFKKSNQNIPNPSCLLTLCNKSRLQELNSFLVTHRRYIIISDEADDNIKKPKTKVMPYYTELIERASHVFYVTATAFKLFVGDTKIKPQNIHVLNPPSTYTSLEDITFSIETEDDLQMPNNGHFLGYDKTYLQYINRLSNITAIFIKDTTNANKIKIHPIICLYKINSNNNGVHREVFNYMKTAYPNWITIVYNGDKKSIPYYHGADIEYKGSLPDLLTHIRKQKLSPPPHILIVSGKYADRMMTFACSGYKWHLSHMRLLASEKTSCVNLTQQCRILGDFPKAQIEQEISCTESTKNDILKADALQSMIIRELKESKLDVPIQKVVRTIRIPKHTVPDRKLDAAISNAEFNIIGNAEGNLYRVDVNLMTEDTDIKHMTKLVIKYFVENKISKFTKRPTIVKYVKKHIKDKSEDNIRGVLSYDKKSSKYVTKTNTQDPGFLYVRKNKLATKEEYEFLYI